MIKITIPNNNISERKYILDIIFDEFLGLSYKIVISDLGLVDSGNWIIELENGAKLIVEDHFFNKHPKDLEYLKLENIPTKIEYVKNKFTPENDIPVIYGTNHQPQITNHKSPTTNHQTLTTTIDIFASSFFMLTRWEEYVNKTRDAHNRFPATESLAYKQGFLNRPIVNEYLEKLKKMLLELDSNILFKSRKFELYLTHDVDHIEKWDRPKKILRHLAGDLIQRKSISEFFKSIVYYTKVKLGIKNDPYDTFDYLMDISEKVDTKSYFFFMAKGLTKYDNRYISNDKKVNTIIKKIKKRGHRIGIHPTYNTFNDVVQFKKEKEELEINLDTNITFGREHYLRFEVPHTWQVWEDNSMTWDSTCSYSDKEGFRCGVCYEYSVFNILTRKKLKLKEKPLIVMDGSAVSKKGIDSEEVELNITKLINQVKKYDGQFVFLWHNSSFNIKEWRDYNNIYEKVLLK